MNLFMATTAPSPLASSVEKTNGAKLSRLLIDGGTTVLRKVFDGHHPPANLITDLNANYSTLNNLLRRRVLNGHQWDKLFPPRGVAPDSKTFDITLLFLLLINICGMIPPPSGWHALPPPSDTSHEANLARVKFYRNVLYGHVTTTGADTPTFSGLWNEITGVLVRLGLDQTEVDRLKAEKGGEQDYIDVLIDWADSEEDIRSQLKNIHQSQSKTHQAVEDVRQAQVKTQKTVEDIHQSQSKTHQAVEDVRQAQVKTYQAQAKTQKTVEELHKTQTDTHQNIEGVQQTMKEVLQTQLKTQHTIEEVRHENAKNVDEVAEGLKEVKETVESLKEKRDKDKADEVLRNLAKSEFRRDIEYHLQRFQDGTREWVFQRVQNWLDDTSSHNRVMVISGNAGMGKSVIAAVVCKRMQQAGRLSGCHFCQYNNVRYCKPQLMIQSLACHLSHDLPEYKQALVEQLSRNLGNDHNNMGVEELFALLFKEPLSAVGDPGRNMLMVIDGLDESEYEGRNELLDVIANQLCKLPIWIRFLITTRPALNIAEKLKHLKPFELNANDKENLEDVRIFCLKRLEHVAKPANVSEFVERLVLKSEGLMLYAHFILLSITENASIFHEGDLIGSSQSGIFSVYHSYFKRLELELLKELEIKEEHFLNLLSAITASREPLPVGFVSKVLVPSTNSSLTRRKVLRALSSVSALLPVRDDCLHVIHKSVPDWLTDLPCYGEHEFTVDENDGHRILAALCTDELENLKRKGVHNIQFSSTERYALHHGVHHMFHEGVKREPHKLDELTKAYVIDLETVFAKTCVNSTIAAEDLVWLKTLGIFALLSKDNQNILETLLFLLRKYLGRFTDTPSMFLQTILNQGGKVLTVDASNILQNKYPEIPYMEFVHKETQEGGVVARFKCSSRVVCLDVSPQLDFMVCECKDGKLQLWSLHTGGLVWTRPVIVEKRFKEGNLVDFARNLPSDDIFSLFRSVVFHPTKECILPGILCQAYTMDGDLKPLFPGSNCRFSVCSIPADKTKILTNCLESSKCLVLWSLENGSEVDRIYVGEDIISFAWSGDGRLVAISHSSRVISLYDVMCNFRKLAQIDTPEVGSVVRFLPYKPILFCYGRIDTCFPEFFFLRVVMETDNTFSLIYFRDWYDDDYDDECHSDYDTFESFNDCGFLFGDLVCTHAFLTDLNFVLDEKRQLRCCSEGIRMFEIEDVNKSDEGDSGEEDTCFMIAFSLDGQTVYVSSGKTITAYDAFSWNLKAELHHRSVFFGHLTPVRGGVLMSAAVSSVVLWDFDLSECIKKWSNLPEFTDLIPISDVQVAVVRDCEVKVLDTSGGEFVSTIPIFDGRVIAFNSKCQLVTVSRSEPGYLQLLDGTTIVWKKEGNVYHDVAGVTFSPMEQFLVVRTYTHEGMLVLNAETGSILRSLPRSSPYFAWSHLTFIDDDKCIVLYSNESTVKLLNVQSGKLLSTIDLKGDVSCLAACPFNGILVIGLQNSAPNVKVIKVHFRSGEDSGNWKR